MVKSSMGDGPWQAVKLPGKPAHGSNGLLRATASQGVHHLEHMLSVVIYRIDSLTLFCNCHAGQGW